MSSVHLFDNVCYNEEEFTFMHYKKKSVIKLNWHKIVTTYVYQVFAN